jgi:hypothetical protein
MALNLTEIFDISCAWKLVLVAGLLFLPPWVEADSSKTSNPDSEIQKHEAIIISQSESEKSSDSEKKDRSSENQDSETESQASEKKPVKDFKPSEKIGAEQAIAFPYDI